MSEVDENSWLAHSKLVMNELKTHGMELRSIRGELADLKTELVVLKTKATMWGATGGFVASVIVGIIIKNI